MPEFGLRMPYRPTDFTQVNHAINRSMVSRALTLLEVQPTDRVADLFCGLGNFTLPLATQGREAVGVEGSKMLTDRAFEAAARHGLAASTSFATLNLFEVDVEWLRGLGYFDRMLIDPPREARRPWRRLCRCWRPKNVRAASSTCPVIRPRWRAMPPSWCMRAATS